MTRPRRYTNLCYQSGLFLLAALAVGISYRYVDEWLARAVMDFLRTWHLSSLGTRKMPDLLLLFVCSATIIMWIDYFLLERSGRDGGKRRFLLLAATATPLAYILKTVLQGVFGRGHTRDWLHNHGSSGFTWLRGDGGFPSGHMLVFTAFFAAVWYYFPRYRVLSALAVLLLAVALIATDYHFLSDLIAGTYLGMLVTAITGRVLERFFAADRTDAGKNR
ncbi:phosphatase PAP2 family protein [Geobacter sp. AOG1]|uniref:phosphatase PAP2 family protein n=1 Tax=Geobacter sp. AOG1 TaxID=1566346 RepID=UPI001CC6A02B|nr:phosphatase PAP2 family protein [Geobacter sp. AOG1]GFE56140.1 phosphatidylglycerophosphatase B [Geobacter sp. AOG1]